MAMKLFIVKSNTDKYFAIWKRIFLANGAVAMQGATQGA